MSTTGNTPLPVSQLAKRVVACLDVAGGRVVKGINFVRLRDAGDPLELAAWYDQQGIDELVVLDITASIETRGLLLDFIKATTEAVFIPVTVGGGVSRIADVHALLQAGADKVAINSAAVRNPGLLTEAARAFGSQCVVVAIDARRSLTALSGWEVFTHGGRRATGRDAVAWAQEATALGAGEILLTSMDTDGTRDGYDVALTAMVSRAVSVPVVASGGAGHPQHLADVLSEGRADAALAASIFHYRQFTVRQTKAYLAAQGIQIRL